MSRVVLERSPVTEAVSIPHCSEGLTTSLDMHVGLIVFNTLEVNSMKPLLIKEVSLEDISILD